MSFDVRGLKITAKESYVEAAERAAVEKALNDSVSMSLGHTKLESDSQLGMKIEMLGYR